MHFLSGPPMQFLSGVDTEPFGDTLTLDQVNRLVLWTIQITRNTGKEAH